MDLRPHFGFVSAPEAEEQATPNFAAEWDVNEGMCAATPHTHATLAGMLHPQNKWVPISPGAPRCPKDSIDDSSSKHDADLLDELLMHIASLASVYHKPPSAFLADYLAHLCPSPPPGTDRSAVAEGKRNTLG